MTSRCFVTTGMGPVVVVLVCMWAARVQAALLGPSSGGTDAAAGSAATASEASTSGEERAVETLLVFVGTYTSGEGKGIYAYGMDLASGKLTAAGVASGIANPSFLAVHPSRRFLYAVNEVGDFAGEKSGAVSAFSIDRKTGRLTLLNQQPSGGAGPCHLVVDSAGRNVLVANYSGGSVAVLPVRDDGRLESPTAFVQHEGSSVNPRRQRGPHAHAIVLDAANRFAFAADLGLDKILVYRFDPAKGTLVPNDVPSASVDPGAGPRHLAFHPNGRYTYVINELSSTVTAFGYNARRGTLETLQTVSTLPEGFQGDNTTAEVMVSRCGKYLYGSNRGHDSIVIFAIDQQTGRLTLVGHEPTQGRTPRNFNIDPTGTYLLAANQGSDTLVVFRIDPDTGRLRPTGNVLSVPKPVCVEMIPVGARFK